LEVARERERERERKAKRNLTQLLLIYKTVIAEGRARG
jgi:hypothetical protein